MEPIHIDEALYYRKKADVLARKLSQALDEITQLEILRDLDKEQDVSEAIEEG